MRKFVKTIAILLSSLMMLSLAACSTSDYITSVEGYEIRNGIYLFYTLGALAEAEGIIYEEEEAAKSETDTSTDEKSTEKREEIFKKQVEGEDVNDWVLNKTRESLLKFVAVEKLFDELELTLTETELKNIDVKVESEWEEENMYLPYIYGEGITTMGIYYEKQGISQKSYKDVVTSSAKEWAIFLSYYGEGGSKAVSKDEINKHLDENNALVYQLPIAFVEEVKDADKEIDKVKANSLAGGYLGKLNSGSSFNEIYDEYVEFLSRANEKDDDKDEEDDTEKEEPDRASVITKTSESPSKEYVEFIYGLEKNGKFQIREEKSAIYLVAREDILQHDESVEKYTESTIYELKKDEFATIIKEKHEDYKFNDNESQIKKYAPKKIKVL